MQRKSYEQWSIQENNLLEDELERYKTMNVAFIAVSRQTGRSVASIQRHYYYKKNKVQVANTKKSWTEEEDQRVIRQVRAFPQNLHKCFLIVSEELDRTPGAVATRWYHILSKRPELRLFITASENNVSVNRKNCTGIESNSSVWRRIVKAINTLFK